MNAQSLLPRLDADNRPFFQAAAEGRLEIQYCSDCSAPRFYPRLLCPECHSDRSQWRESKGAGTLYSFAVVRRAPTPSFADRVPYVVALIDLDEGVRVFANVFADPDQMQIDQRVRVQIKKVSDEVGIPEFVIERGED